MTKEEKQMAEREFERVKQMLDERGIQYEVHRPFISFDNGEGETWVFPSQTYGGKLCVRYVKKEWHNNAEDALMACGVFGAESA